MIKRLTPQQKKHYRYQRDFETPAEYPHAFRKKWPKKKAISIRSERHKARQLLEVILDKDTAELQDNLIKSSRRNQPKKWGVWTVAERVTFKTKKRQNRIGWNYFKESYSTAKHREPFKQFLNSMMAGYSQESKHQATIIKEWLKSDNLKHSQWMNQFFIDELSIKIELEAWINRLSK